MPAKNVNESVQAFEIKRAITHHCLASVYRNEDEILELLVPTSLIQKRKNQTTTTRDWKIMLSNFVPVIVPE